MFLGIESYVRTERVEQEDFKHTLKLFNSHFSGINFSGIYEINRPH